MLHANQDSTPVEDELALLQRRLERERRARQQAEAVLEAKSLDLYQKHQELVRLNLRLEDRVKQRTEELADAMAKAQRASVAKGEFLARMSHEIRTPMNGVIGMLEALRMTSLQPEQADYLETAHTSATSLLGLINDILDFSKIEAGQMSIESIRFDMNALLTHVVHLWEPIAQHRGLYLQAKIDPATPRALSGDPTRLMQVLTNLISNALKFTHQGGVTLRVDVINASAKNDYVDMVFVVEDTGIGIPEEARARLFTAFMQADGSTSRRYGGTGLGLAICDQLARLMKGTIEVHSEEGCGTRFTLRLNFGVLTPLAESTTHASTALNQSVASSGGNAGAIADAPAIRAGKVLVVDDNETNQKVALTILKRFGIDADCANDGREAIQAVQSQHYDLVLMDCHMPVVDGYEATTIIRAWEREKQRSQLTIVAVTASAFQEDKDHCAACGMNDFVAKPINIKAIRAVLERWLPANPPPSAEVDTTIASVIQSDPDVRQAVAALFEPSKQVARVVDLPNAEEFDLEQYDELRELAAAEFPAMLRQFHHNVVDTLQSLHAAASDSNADTVKKLAHRLKGATATLGAKLLSNECALLEAEARTGNLSRAIERVTQLNAHYDRICQWPEFSR